MRFVKRSLPTRRIDRNEQWLKEMLVAPHHELEPGFPKQPLERRQLDRVVPGVKFMNDWRLRVVLLSDPESEVVLVAVPSPDLLCGVPIVTDRPRAGRMIG